jgi:hypothetical protein
MRPAQSGWAAVGTGVAVVVGEGGDAVTLGRAVVGAGVGRTVGWHAASAAAAAARRRARRRIPTIINAGRRQVSRTSV